MLAGLIDIIMEFVSAYLGGIAVESALKAPQEIHLNKSLANESMTGIRRAIMIIKAKCNAIEQVKKKSNALISTDHSAVNNFIERAKLFKHIGKELAR